MTNEVKETMRSVRDYFPSSPRAFLALVCGQLLVFATACGPMGQAQWLAKYDADIRGATTSIESARDDIQRARGYSARGRGYAEKARYSRAMRIISLAEYQKLFGLAIQDHGQAITVAPKDGAVYLDRGRSYYDRAAYAEPGDAESRACFDNALADFTRTTQLDPASADAFDMRGLVFTALGDHDHAIEDFTRLQTLNPSLGKTRLADAYCLRGAARTAAKNYDLAIADYEKAVVLGASADSCDCQPHSPLAGLYLETRQFDKSWAVVTEARKAGKWIMPELIERLRKESPRAE